MRIRTAKFAMIPMWVIAHPEVRGNGTRIAVYAGLHAVAWEAPDMVWRSTREMAVAVSEIVGIGDEACRKHLSALVLMGAIVKTDDEVILPVDEPGVGNGVGTVVPNVGFGGTQSGGRTSTSKRSKKKTSPVGTHGDGAKPKSPGRELADRLVREWWDELETKPAQNFIGIVRLIETLPAKGWTEADICRGLREVPTVSGRALDLWRNGTKPRAASLAKAAADNEAAQLDDVVAARAAGNPDLAWRIVKDRARAGVGTVMFAEVADRLEQGLDDVSITRVLRGVTVEYVAEVVAARAAVFAPVVSPAGLPSPS